MVGSVPAGDTGNGVVIPRSRWADAVARYKTAGLAAWEIELIEAVTDARLERGL